MEFAEPISSARDKASGSPECTPRCMWFVEATVGEESIGELLLDVTPAGGGLARAPDTDGGQGSSRRETLNASRLGGGSAPWDRLAWPFAGTQGAKGRGLQSGYKHALLSGRTPPSRDVANIESGGLSLRSWHFLPMYVHI